MRSGSSRLANLGQMFFCPLVAGELERRGSRIGGAASSCSPTRAPARSTRSGAAAGPSRLACTAPGTGGAPAPRGSSISAVHIERTEHPGPLSDVSSGQRQSVVRDRIELSTFPFQVNRAKRCAELQKRTSLTSETALGERCSVHASRAQCTPSTRQDGVHPGPARPSLA